MPTKPAPLATLTLRELNRAMLARQMLLRRERINPVKAIERIGALQAQYAPAPYIALWSRISGFALAKLERALDDRRAVKATLIRGTLHIVSAADYPAFAIVSPEARKAQWATTERTLLRYFADLSAAAAKAAAAGRGIGDTAKMRAALLAYARKARSRDQLTAFISERSSLPSSSPDTWCGLSSPRTADWSTFPRAGGGRIARRVT